MGARRPPAVHQFLQRTINANKAGCSKGPQDPFSLLTKTRRITLDVFARTILQAIAQCGDGGHRQQVKDKLKHLRTNCPPKVIAGSFALAKVIGK